MKKDTHPEYFTDATIKCACGNVIAAGSTNKDQLTEICSACHPFFTGKQKLIDTAGRVDKFRARQKAAEAKKAAEKKAEVKEDDEPKEKKEDKEKKAE